MPRGGARNGKPGVSYPQRTDLGVAKLPAVAAPGQVYGAAKQQISAQQQLPMAAQPTPGSQPQGQVETPGVQPGSLGPLHAPTARPDEPLTHGAMGGPGAGPEILTGPPPPPPPALRGLAILNSLGDQLPPELRALRDSLGASQAQL